jgi:hypothetical protein
MICKDDRENRNVYCETSVESSVENQSESTLSFWSYVCTVVGETSGVSPDDNVFHVLYIRYRYQDSAGSLFRDRAIENRKCKIFQAQEAWYSA